MRAIKRNKAMKTFKIFYKWRVEMGQANNQFETNFSFVKAETEEEAVAEFKSEFRPEVIFEITSIIGC